MLTARQKQVFDFIVHYMRCEGGVSPSCDDIAAGIGSKSKGNVSRMLKALEERGFIRRLSRHARAIEVLKRPPRRPPAPSMSSLMDVTLPTDIGAAPPAVKRLCPTGKISGAYQASRYVESR